MDGKAMKMDLIRKNVSNNCELPPIRKTEMHPLTKEEMGTFMTLAKNDEYSMNEQIPKSIQTFL